MKSKSQNARKKGCKKNTGRGQIQESSRRQKHTKTKKVQIKEQEYRTGEALESNELKRNTSLSRQD